MEENDDSCYSLNLNIQNEIFEHEEIGIKAKIRSKAPEFMGTSVFQGGFRHIDLLDYLGKYLVILFYPLDFTLGCPREVLEFSSRQYEFAKVNTDIIACSVDSEYAHLAWCNTPKKCGGVGTLEIPLLSDLSRKISKDYGVLIDDLGHTFRAIFIIDKRGILRQKTINDVNVYHSVDEVLRLVELIQHTDITKAPYGSFNSRSKCIKSVR